MDPRVRSSVVRRLVLLTICYLYPCIVCCSECRTPSVHNNVTAAYGLRLALALYTMLQVISTVSFNPRLRRGPGSGPDSI